MYIVQHIVRLIKVPSLILQKSVQLLQQLAPVQCDCCALSSVDT